MKKFLTVLLALSVVFTYTVGTAFAATGADPVKYTAEEVQTQLYNVISSYEKAMTGNVDRVVTSYNLDEKKDYDIQVKKEAVKEAAASFIKTLVSEMTKIANAEVVEADKAAYTADQLAAAKAKIVAYVESYGAKAETYKYEAVGNIKTAEDVSSLFVLDGQNYKAATGNAVYGTTYFTRTEETPADQTALDGTYYSEKDGVYEPATGTADGVTIYSKFMGKTPVEYGDAVDSYFLDDKGTQKASGYAQPNTSYYEKKVDVPAVQGTDLTTVAGFKVALDASIDLAKAETPRAEAFYLAAIEKDYALANYPADGDFIYNGVQHLTAQQAVSAIKDDAVKAIKAAKDTLSKIAAPTKDNYETATAAYKTAFGGIATAITAAGIKNNEQNEDGKTAVEIAINAAISELKAYALGTYTTTMWDGITTPQGTDTVSLKALADAYGADIYTVKTSVKNATLFGVEIKDIEKATRAEVIAVKSAYLKAVNDTVDAVKKSVEAKGLTTAAVAKTAIEETYKKDGANNEGTFTGTVKAAYKVADKYNDVVDRGNALKKAVQAGTKLYDDAKVDAVVKQAVEYVYEDMGVSTVDAYFVKAINKVYNKAYTAYDKAVAELLLAGDYEYDKLVAAIKTAVDKFQDRIVTIGANATPEADKKYCKNYYATTVKNSDGKAYGDLYDKIKADAVKALNEAQSYDDITAAVKAADTELAKLMLAENETAVKDAQDKYKTALTSYMGEVQSIKGTTDYAVKTYTDTKAAGDKLITDAVTVDGVKAAFDAAKALFDDMKKNAELTTLKEAVEKEINALPLSSKVTAADAEKIEAARASYNAYVDTYGVETLSLATQSRLKNAENALYTLERDALNAEIKAMQDKLGKIDAASADVAVSELLALKEEMSTLAAKAKAFNDKMEDMEISLSVDADAIAAKLNLAEGSVWAAEVYLTEVAMKKALNQDTLNNADINAAFEAYKALTNRQQYKVDKDTNYAIKLIEAKVIASVESLKITASSKAVKGKITVKWKVKGDATAIDGYRVYKSTKANSGYKFMGKTKKLYMDNKKNLKKGKRYFYKVRAYKVVDGKTYYSDYSNKANRYAK